MVSPATLSRVDWIMRPSKKQELLSCMGESQTSQVEFSSAGATRGNNLPQVDLAKAPYPVRKEKFDRMLNGALCFQPDMGNQFVSGLQLYQNEFRLSSISSNPNFVGECKIYREVISTKSGTNANKVDSAFREDLSLVGSDKDKRLQKIGLQMHKKVHRLHVRSQADEFSSVNNFSRCFAEVSEQTPPSTSCRGAQSSVSCSIQRKKLTKPLSKRRRACMDWDFSDWEYEEALPLGNCSGGQSLGSCSQPQRKSARLLNKRKRVCMDLDLLNWELEEAQNVVLLDDEDLCAETMDGSDDEWKKFRLYYPSRNDPESVALSYSDMECLNPEQFLSSPVMNFYIQYLRSEPTIGRPQGEYHIFNTFFFEKLERALSQKVDGSQCFLKLRRWWKGVNIFSKAYILLPIHGSSHWSLAIICNPGIEEDDSNLLILHLDSLGLHSTQQISQIISIFLQEEWNFMNQNPAAADLPFPLQRHIWQHLQLRIDRKKVKVPQQKNEYDCGIFVLYFIQRFLEEAPQRLRLHDLSMFHSKWFKPAEASSLRKRIQNLLIEEFNKAVDLP